MNFYSFKWDFYMIDNKEDLDKLVFALFKIGFSDNAIAMCVEHFPEKLTEDFLETVIPDIKRRYRMYQLAIYNGHQDILMEKSFKISLRKYQKRNLG